MKDDKFPLTSEGYNLAMIWLKQTNQLHLIENELSKDGYTITALANHLFERSLTKTGI